MWDLESGYLVDTRLEMPCQYEMAPPPRAPVRIEPLLTLPVRTEPFRFSTKRDMRDEMLIPQPIL